MLVDAHLFKTVKKTPIDHINQIFINHNGVMSFLTNEEDILKSNAYFGAEPYHLYLTNNNHEDWETGDIVLHMNGHIAEIEHIDGGPIINIRFKHESKYQIKAQRKDLLGTIIASTNKELHLSTLNLDFNELSDLLTYYGDQGFAKPIPEALIKSLINKSRNNNEPIQFDLDTKTMTIIEPEKTYTIDQIVHFYLNFNEDKTDRIGLQIKDWFTKKYNQQ